MDIFTELIRQLGKQLDLYNGIDSDDDNDNVNEDNVNEDNVNEDNVNDDNKSKLDTFIINTQPKNTQPENTPVYSKYTVINVGNGEPLPFKLPGGYKERYNDKLLITQSNIENKKDSKSFLHSFMNAYNNHLDMVLSPDDIWVFICLQFSAYVNDNADKIKHKFVNHEGKKQLTVITSIDLDENKWDEFFDLMLDKIKENTSEDAVNTLQCDFSTTTNIEKIISTSVIMDTFKQYFKYGRCIPLCGIRNVLFMGTLNDWERIIEKLNELSVYDVDGKLQKYVDELIPVMQQIIDTYKGVDKTDFWDKIMNIEHGAVGSGSITYISGWILKFYNLGNNEEKITANELTEYETSFPVTIENHMTSEKTVVNFASGLNGIRYEELNEFKMIRPAMNYSVCEVSREPL
jgi:hypothetical protein